MRRNETALLAHTDQVDDVTVEARIGKFESDLGHVKKDVAQISAYWVSLRGHAKSENEETETVRVPCSQRFDVVALSEMMERIASGGVP